MAFRNSVKVTMLALESENEKSRFYPTQTALLYAPETVAPPVVRDAARAPVLVSKREIGTITAAEMWHGRADVLRAMTDTLPSAITRGLMAKIIALYDGFAREEGWSDLRGEPQQAAAPAAPPPEESRFEDEFPDDDAPLSLAPASPAWPAFARRPLPAPRRAGRRR